MRVTQGTVTRTDDPAKAGRLKVTLPEMDGGEYPEWVDPVSQPGWLWLPEPGDTVTVLLPDDDRITEFPEEARWIGQLYDQDNQHPVGFRSNYPKMRGFETKAGHQLIVDDKAKDILITTASGHQLNLKGDDTVELQNGGSGAKIVLNPDGSILIEAGSPVDVHGDPINLGNGNEPLVLGTTYNTQFSAYMIGIAALTTAAIAQYTALESAATGVLAPLQPGFTGLKTAWTTFQSIVTTFQAAFSTWLSVKVNTD